MIVFSRTTRPALAWWGLLLALVITLPTASQSLTPDQAHDDLLYLRRQLRTYHPGLGHYTPVSRMEQVFDSLYNHVDAPIDYLAFFRHLSPYLSGLKDGHTNLNHRKGFINRDTRYVPFYIRQVEGHYFISHNASEDSTLRRGTQLISIDGQSVADIHRALLEGDRSGSDGDNVSGRQQWSLTQFADYYACWFGSRDSITVQYRSPLPNGKIDSVLREKRISCPTVAHFREKLWQRYPTDFGPKSESRLPNLGLRIVDSLSGTAVLRVSSFSSPHGFDPFGWGFKKRLKQAFRQIKEAGVDNLIVDMQDNGGGAVVNSARLLQFWMPAPFRIMAREEMKQAARPQLVNRWNPLSVIDFNLRYKKDGHGGFISRVANRQYRPIQRLAFTGNLYLLMNGSSFSAATSVLAKTLDAGKGTFVGEASGGAYWGDFAGQFNFVTLPHSRIQVRLPLKKLTHAVAPNHANGFTVEPDFTVTRSYNDLLTNRNYTLDYTLKLIRQRVTAARDIPSLLSEMKN
ncbi:PDZ domain-containing protein [Fibrella sp. HMF5335]|uniref:PDZ domain-containing protein n=1 Tax=Fibrella rubiginis TaxID=2817060 RepID=A0A939GI05_9BACT|nr:S41 family peptidase [Fibrella rubiginis]MBO0937835.1 PDZ domain-containing protein [Fibrella rubiginis]